MPSDDPADLRAVRGIGPKAEARLKEAGVADLATLARTPVNELAAALAGLRGKFDADRIAREEWIAQAAALAVSVSRSAPGSAERDTAQPVRHSFTVEVRLPQAGREVVSTRITHVPTGDEEAWGGWDPERLAEFIQDRSGLRVSAPRAGSAAAEVRTRPAPVPEPAGHPGPEPESGPVPQPEPAPSPGRLHAYAMVPASGPGFAGGRARTVTAVLTVGPGRLGLTGSGPACVRAQVLARQLLAGGTVVVGRGSAAIDPAGPVRLEVPCDLSAVHRPLVLCALIRVIVPERQERPPVQELTGAQLLISS